MSEWPIFNAAGQPTRRLEKLPSPPPWRSFGRASKVQPPADLESNPHWTTAGDRGKTFKVLRPEVTEAVNAALYLRRPLLLTGVPGSGKSTLISAVAWELRMGPVLKWPITSRSNLRQGLYDYDALARLHATNTGDAGAADIGNFLTLGPLGSALYATPWPRPLLIDEIDKSDLDLPNDLLNIFEDGEFTIPELERADQPTVRVKAQGLPPAPGADDRVEVNHGRVQCVQFPFVVMTSNGEREFPAPFLRRCIRLDMPRPTATDLADIVQAHLGQARAEGAGPYIDQVLQNLDRIATDQLLNAVFLILGGNEPGQAVPPEQRREALRQLVLRELA